MVVEEEEDTAVTEEVTAVAVEVVEEEDTMTVTEVAEEVSVAVVGENKNVLFLVPTG